MPVASLQCTCHLNPLEDLDTVADAHVIVVLHADTALHAVTHFTDVVLEAAQGLQLAFVDDHVLAQYADRTVAVYGTFDDHAASHGTELGRTEHVTHLGHTEDLFAYVTAEHAGQGLLHVLDDLVDHAVVAQIQTFTLDHLARRGIGPHVEAEDHRVGGQCQVDIGFGDTTDTAGDHLDLYFVVTQLVERALQGFQGTAHVGLYDHVENLLLILAHVLEH